jgi:hypothetical protein
MENLYEIAKEKGYSGEEKLELLQSWIRKTYFLHPEIYFSKFHKVWFINNFFINVKKGKSTPFKNHVEEKYDTYEEALEKALFKLLT